MPIKFCLMLAVWLGLSAVSAAARQGPAERTDTPEPTPNSPSESAKREHDRLLKPDFFLLRIVSGYEDEWDTPQEEVREFKVGQPIGYKLLMLNTSGEVVTLTFTDEYDQNRPQLYKDGVLVPYRKQAASMVEAKDKRPMVFRMIPADIENNATASAYIRFQEWYEPLGEGAYQLAIRRRFVWGGEWLESPPVRFRIRP
jgi:hypothetical protein